MSAPAAQRLARHVLGVGRRVWRRPAGVVRRLDAQTAVVQLPDGQRAVARSTVPLWTQRAGESTPVDLTLHRTRSVIAPAASLVPVTIAATVEGGVSWGALGFSDDAANPDASASTFADKAFFANSDEDTDFMVAVAPRGVEAQWALRSAASPEDLALKVRMPAGAALSADPAVPGGARVTRDGQVLATVAPPSAVDADGVAVPAGYTVSGATLEVHVAHRDRDVHYPLLVDPYWATTWGNGPNGNTNTFAGWTSATSCTQNVFGAAGSVPLFVGAYGGVPWPANCKGSWGFTAPGNSWIFEADLANVNHTVYGGFTNFVSIGILNKDGTGPGGWAYADANSGPISLQPTAEYAAMSNAARRVCTTQTFTNGQVCPATPRSTAGYVATAADGGNVAFFGLQNSVGGTYPSDQRAYVYGVTLLFGDAVKPTVPIMSGVPVGWVRTASASLTLSSSENGLGIAGYDVAISASSYSNFFGVACTYAYTAPFAPCKWSPPPTTAAVSTTIADGVHTVSANARTPVLSGNPATAPLKIDAAKPTIALSGSLTGHQPSDLLTDGSYNLHIAPSDGDATVARSGVTSVTVSVSNVGAAADTQTFTNTTCGTGNTGCSTTNPGPYDYTYNVSALKPGLHTATVTAVDAAGNVSNPATATFSTFAPVSADAEVSGLERYLPYDSTPTGPDSTARVNLANGNLVWQQQLFNNPGRGLNTPATLTFNSQQPALGGLLGYNSVGRGFSLGIAGLTRVNEPLAINPLGPITLTDADGTRHTFSPHAGSGQSALGIIPSLATAYDAPPGVHLRFRRFTSGLGADNERAWAATRPDGVTYYFNAAGYQTLIVDRNGNTLHFHYDFAMPLTSLLPTLLQGTAGLVCNTATGLIDNITSLALISGSILPVCAARLQSVTDAGGRQVGLSYNADGTVDKITDHAGHVTKFGYDTTAGTLTSVTSADGTTNPDGTTDARSYRFKYTPRPSLLDLGPRDLLAICDPRSDPNTDCAPGVAHSTTVTYPGVRETLGGPGPVISLTDRNFHKTNYAYADKQSQHYATAVVTDARAKQTTYTMDARSRPIAIVDALARRTELQWNDVHNEVSADTRAKNVTGVEATTSYTYNPNGLLATRTDPLGHTTTLAYNDTAGNQTSTVGGAEDPARQNYVSDLTSITTPRGTLGTTRQNSTFTTFFDHDGAGNVTTITDPPSTNALNGDGGVRGVVTATYDASGQTLTQTDETGNVTSYESYDASGLPTVKIDPRGNAHSADRTVGRWLYNYDADGNLQTQTDPRGASTGDITSPRTGTPYTTTYGYDNLNRVVTADIPRLSATGGFVHRKWLYDKNDNVTTFADAVGYAAVTAAPNPSTSLAGYHTDYNSMDMPVEQRTPAVAHASETATAPETTDFGYDEVDNLTSVKAPMAAGKDAQGNPFLAGSYTTMLAYDDANQRTSVTRQQIAKDINNQTQVTKLITSMAYDARGNVVGVADPAHNAKPACAGLVAPATPASTPTCQRYSLTYDKADNLLHQIEDPSAIRPHDTSYTYYPDNAVDAITDEHGNTSRYGYDERGQRTDATNPVGAKTTWQYDLAGRLGKLTKPNGTATGASGDYETVYTYDPDGYLTDEKIPRAAGQYGSAWVMHYIRNAVGDATTITDPRGHSFDNTYYDTGELRSTERPSMYTFAAPAAPDGTPQAGQSATNATSASGAPEVTQLSYSDLLAHANDSGPAQASAPGDGSFGAVAQLPIPAVMPRAGHTDLGYDDEMRLTSVRDVQNTNNTISRDVLGRITSITQPVDDTHQIQRTWQYDRDGNVATFDSGDKDANNVEVVATYGFDQFERLTSSTIPWSTGTSHATDLATTGYGYDANDNLVSQTSPLGHTTNREYDAIDRVTGVTDPLQHKTGYVYRDDTNEMQVITPTGMTKPQGAARDPYTTSYFDNAASQLDHVTDGSGHTTSYGYDADGNMTSQTRPGAADHPGGDPVDRTTTQTFDGRDLPWVKTVGDGSSAKRTTITEFDANGDLRRTVNPAGVNTDNAPLFRDNGDGPITTTPDANRFAEVREYNDAGLLTHVDQPKGAAGSPGNDDHLFQTDFTYRDVGFVDTVSLPHDVNDPLHDPAVLTGYLHYLNGWIRSSSDPSHTSSPGIQTLSYTYDGRGDQTSWTRTSGTTEPSRAITRSFAADGAVTSRTASKGGIAPRTYDYSYDRDGNLLTLTTTKDPEESRQDKVERFSYYNDGRLKNANNPLSATDTHMTYTDDGLVHTRQTDGTLSTDEQTYSGGKTTTIDYDTLGRQSTLTVAPSDGTSRKTDFGYWPSGDVRTRTTYEPTSDPAQQQKVNHESYYDPIGELVRNRRLDPSGALIAGSDHSYTYDPDGNRTADEKGGETYNARDQLVHWTRAGGGSVDYTVNGSGAVRSVIDSTGADTENTLDGDRLTDSTTTVASNVVQTATYDYDGFGNITAIHQHPASGPDVNVSYTFDAFERLVTAQDSSRTPSITTYTHDGLDRRDTKTTGGKTTTFGYIGTTNALSNETIGTDGTTRSYDYDATGTRQGQQAKPAGSAATYRPYITDAQGSVLGLETATGTTLSGTEHAYDPYGTPTAGNADDTLNDSPFRFQGFYYDPTAGGYNALAREYRPDIQRFLTQDRYESAGADLGLAENSLTGDRYAFGAGNPTSRIDDDGHAPCRYRLTNTSNCPSVRTQKAANAADLSGGRHGQAHEVFIDIYRHDPAAANRVIGSEQEQQQLELDLQRRDRDRAAAALNAQRLPPGNIADHLLGDLCGLTTGAVCLGKNTLETQRGQRASQPIGYALTLIGGVRLIASAPKVLGLGRDAIGYLTARGAATGLSHADELLGNASDVVVLGRRADTVVAKGWEGHVVLDTPNWSLKLNDEFIEGAINQRRRVYLASPTNGNLVQTSGRYAGQPTIYARELRQLKNAGYMRRGDYLEPPG